MITERVMSDLPQIDGAAPEERLALDREFVRHLQKAGLLDELDDHMLATLSNQVKSEDPLSRRLELLEAYYGGAGDAVISIRRRSADRFMMHRAKDPVTAQMLVERMGLVTPQLGEVHIERIGDDGPVVLRSGAHMAAVVDTHEDVDDAHGRPLVTVRSLVHALNALMNKAGARERLVGLLADEEREAYVATTIAHALNLCKAGLLEDANPEEMVELAAW